MEDLPVKFSLYLNPKSGIEYQIINVANTHADENRKDKYPTMIIYQSLRDLKVWAVTPKVWKEKNFTKI